MEGIVPFDWAIPAGETAAVTEETPAAVIKSCTSSAEKSVPADEEGESESEEVSS